MNINRINRHAKPNREKGRSWAKHTLAHWNAPHEPPKDIKEITRTEMKPRKMTTGAMFSKHTERCRDRDHGAPGSFVQTNNQTRPSTCERKGQRHSDKCQIGAVRAHTNPEIPTWRQMTTDLGNSTVRCSKWKPPLKTQLPPHPAMNWKAQAIFVYMSICISLKNRNIPGLTITFICFSLALSGLFACVMNVDHTTDNVSMRLEGPCDWVIESNRQISPYQSKDFEGKWGLIEGRVTSGEKGIKLWTITHSWPLRQH